MNPEIDSHQSLVLKEFIEERWQKFLSHCRNFGLTESEAEDIASKLNAKS